jgi:hypothetical protein
MRDGRSVAKGSNPRGGRVWVAGARLAGYLGISSAYSDGGRSPHSGVLAFGAPLAQVAGSHGGASSGILTTAEQIFRIATLIDCSHDIPKVEIPHGHKIRI